VDEDPRVRILRVIARMNMGGPAYHVSLLSGLLDRRGYDTLLVTGSVATGEASMEEVADRYGARRRLVDSLKQEHDLVADARALLTLVRIARRFRPHIVHTHTAKAGFLGRLAALALRPRPVIVHTYHGHVLEDYFGRARGALYRQLERAMGRVSDRLVGVSNATVEDLVRLRVAPRERFTVIPLGLDLEPFESLPPESNGPFRSETGVVADDVLLVYMGRVVPIKRLDVLLRALALARERGARVKLALVGDGTSRPELESLAGQLGLGRAVSFTGYRRDLADIAAAADVGVLSSDNEGTPVSLIELAAAGRPLVATRAGGVTDVVTPACGEVVPRGDHEAFADALVRLSGDAELRRRMGLAGREHVRRRFAVDRLVADMDALYRELLSTESP
jgi:glycosyltransferase involved in cell wall biosynthesis